MLRKLTLITLTFVFFEQIISSQINISGTVLDSISLTPVEEVRAEIYGTNKAAYTNSKGNFILNEVSPGIHTIILSKAGYFSAINSYTVDSSASLHIEIKLQSFQSVTDTIDVSANYFKKKDEVNTSFLNAEYEEIRKSPGAMEDVIRYFTSSPGVSLGNDINNEIIVRGGSPVENLTLVDGLIIQNPNHYGAPGSTNGVLSYINLKMVKDVDFFSGGFPPVYGDRLSGVMEIKFRKGNSARHVRDINISATGFGGFFEGPITNKSAYMFSVRRSYYELIKDLLETALIPEYWDINMKLNYEPSKNDEISLTSLFATDNARPVEEGDFMYDTVNVKILSAGINYKKTGAGFNFNLVAGYGWNFYKVNYQDFILDINDNELSVKQTINFQLSKKFTLTVFTGTRHFFSKYNVQHGSGFNASNYYTPSVSFKDDVNTLKFYGGFNLLSYLFNGRLILNTGFRFDSFQLINDKFVFSPRVGFTYRLTPVTTLNANAGIYYQAPEMLWVLVDTDNRRLKNIRVEEIVLGFEHLFSYDTKLSIEPYLKQYYDYPVSVYDPNYIYINSGVEIYPNFLDKALSAGRGYFTGVDITFQKKNAGKGFFMTAAYSFSHSKFLALAGDIQPAEFDYGNQLTFIAGYKFSFGLALSTRFKFAKGRPYTPYNYEQSTTYNRGIYNISLYNREKMPDYARLDLRVDQELKMGNTELVVYIELINTLNRENYYNFYWSSYYKRLRSNLQFPRVPILGISYKF